MDTRIKLDVAFVQRLVATQFPQWAGLPVQAVAEGGWNNLTFHLGTAMSVRLPSAERYVAQVEKEVRWLPVLAPQLPLPVPTPLGLGQPGEGYPWPWSVYGWIEGETAKPSRIADLTGFALDLADFLNALRAIDAADGPVAGLHNFHRGGDLQVYDAETRDAIEILSDEIDVMRITSIWDAALGSRWTDAPVWVHGDVTQGNLLVQNGKLSAVIDFGTCGTGDPACDLAIAWTLLDQPAREAFRNRVGLDADTWRRARGWCLWKALIVIAAEHDAHPAIADRHRVWIEKIVADHLEHG